MNLTKDQLKDIVSSSIRAQLAQAQAGRTEKTRMTRTELKSVVREMIESALTEGKGTCEDCDKPQEECECEAACESCGNRHDEMDECGVGYTKTTVMEGLTDEKLKQKVSDVSAKEFQTIVRQMIIEESSALNEIFGFGKNKSLSAQSAGAITNLDAAAQDVLNTVRAIDLSQGNSLAKATWAAMKKQFANMNDDEYHELFKKIVSKMTQDEKQEIASSYY